MSLPLRFSFYGNLHRCIVLLVILVLSSNDLFGPSFTLAPIYGQDHLGKGLVLAALAPELR
jgi:hypothetical protein